MRIYHAYIKITVLITALFLVSSCLKKVDVEDLNTNVYDEEYDNGVWFEISEKEVYVGDDLQEYIHLSVKIPEEKIPELKPTVMFISVSQDEINGLVKEFKMATGGDFYGSLNFPYEGFKEYCLSMGIFVEGENGEEDRVINTYEICYTI